eukprot:5680401-Pyramimonas_sp.AAC.1
MGSPASSKWRTAPEERENTPLLSLRPIHSSLRFAHHPGPLIIHTHSSLRLTHHDSDSSLISQIHSSFRLTHHSDSPITQAHARFAGFSTPNGSGGG